MAIKDGKDAMRVWAIAGVVEQVFPVFAMPIPILISMSSSRRRWEEKVKLGSEMDGNFGALGAYLCWETTSR